LFDFSYGDLQFQCLLSSIYLISRFIKLDLMFLGSAKEGTRRGRPSIGRTKKNVGGTEAQR
jgi:hypothetical protein